MAKFWDASEAGFFFKRPDSGNSKEWKFVLSELEMLFVEDKAEKIENDYMIPHSVAASFGEEERSILSLPEVFPYYISIKTSGTIGFKGFHYIVEFLRPDGSPFINPVVIGSLITISPEREYMFSSPQFQIVSVAMSTNEKLKILVSHKDLMRDGLLSVAKLKEYGKTVEAILDGIIEKQKIVVPDKLSINVRKCEDGSYTVEPVLLKKNIVDGETKYNPIENASFAPAFSKKDIVEASYVGSNGVRYVFDDNLIKGLQEVKKYKKIDQKTAEELIIGASSKFDSSIFEFDLKFYADRVIDIAEYVRKNLPYIRPDNGGWLPEEGEAGQGEDNPLEGIEINKETSKVLYEALHAAQSDKKESFVYEERVIPITPKVVEIIETAYRKFWGTTGIDEPDPDGGTELPIDQPGGTAGPEGGNPPATGGGNEPAPEPVVKTKKKVLIIEDNIEQLKYIEKKRSDESNQITNENILNGLAEDIRLYQHQKDGVAWILKCWKEGYKGVLLADDMGLGKTAQALAFISGRKANSEKLFRQSVLIVAPVSLLENWKEEIKRFVKPGLFKSTVSFYGDEAARFKVMSGLDLTTIAENHIVLTTYETLKQYQLYLGKIDWSVMIIDEAQKIKNPTTMAAMAVKAMKYDFAIAMSGTPVENSWIDLWSIVDFVMPGKLSSLNDFNTNYQNKLVKFKNDQKELEQLGKQLKKNLEPIFLRRLKKKYLKDLPHKKIIKKKEVMPEEQRIAYESIVREAKNKTEEGTVNKKNMLQIIAQLRDVSLYPYLATYSDKALMEEDLNTVINSSARLKWTFQVLINIRSKNEKALIFVTSKKMQRLVHRLVEEVFGIEVEAPINGELLSGKRQRIIDKFCNAEGFNVLILSPEAAGIGLNITAANHVIHLGRCWNPAKEDQATDRAYRIGQKKDVNVYIPMACHPKLGENAAFDEKLDELLEFKRKLSDSVIFPTGDSEADGIGIYTTIINIGGGKGTDDSSETGYWKIEDMKKLDGYVFEQVITDLFNNIKDYQASKTPDHNDNGADVVVYCDTKQKTGYLIQCKQTSTDNAMGKVGVEEVLGAIPYYQNLHHYKFRGVVVTNALKYSRNAIEKAKQNNIRLIAAPELKSLFEKYPTRKTLF